MIDTDFERDMVSPMLILNNANAHIKAALDNLTDNALCRLYALVRVVKTGGAQESTDALATIERMAGTLTTDEFRLLDQYVHEAFDNRFGPVPGL